MRRHLLATAVILTVAPGCDNVAWGGIDVRWEPPVPAVAGTPAATAASAEALEPEAVAIPRPLVLAGTRDGSRADLVVVAEVGDRGVAPATVMSLTAGATEGSEWILFAEGARVGRVTVDRVGSASDYCAATPTLSGVVELVPTASSVSRVIGLPPGAVGRRPFEGGGTVAQAYEDRVASLGFAQEAIPRVGAPWPDGGVLATRQDLQSFQPMGTASPTLAATYNVRDQIAIGTPPAGAYSLFILSAMVAGSYRETFEWYQSASAQGKAVPRYFGHLDLDGDGRGEVILDVFGSDRRWHAVLEQNDDGWARTFESSCGAVASQAR